MKRCTPLLRKATSVLILVSFALMPPGVAVAEVGQVPDSGSIHPAPATVIADPGLNVFNADDPSPVVDPEVETASLEEPLLEKEEVPAEEQPGSTSLATTAGGAQSAALSFEIPTQPRATIDQSSGALAYEYPIELPEGRAGLTPELSLRYNSRAITRPDSVAGLGWEISIPYIQREPVRGTQNLYTKPFFSSSVSGNLIATTDVSVTSYTMYSPETDDGSYLRYVFNSDQSWTATGKDGRTYTFGGSAASRQDAPGNPSKVYRWMISKIADSHGNEIQYSYIKDQGQIYPSQITYTYHPSSPAVHTVGLAYTTPASYGSTVYNAAFPVVTAKLLSTITVATVVGTDRTTDTYTLYHENAQFLKQKLLTSIERLTDFAVAEYNQPFNRATWFAYSTKLPGWEQGTYSLEGYLAYQDDNIFKDIYTADFDLNGYPDVFVSYHYLSTNNNYLMLNDGTHFTDATTSWSLPTDIDLSSEYAIADLNGDRLPDLQPRFFEVHEAPPIYLNTGSGFVADYSGTWFMKNHVPEIVNCGPNVGDSESYNTNTFLYDINRDGKNDIVYFGGATNFKVYLNDGTGWTATTAYTFTINPGSIYDFSRHCITQNGNWQALLDINGDGIEDYIHESFGTYLNTGNGFAYSAAYSLDIREMSRSGLADINGDSLLDYVSTTNSVGSRSARVFLNNGAGFSIVNPSSANSNVWDPNELKYTVNDPTKFGTLMDFTGDGYPDIAGLDYIGRVRAINDAQKAWTWNSNVRDQWEPIVTPSHGVFFDINTDGVLDFIAPEPAWNNEEQPASKVHMGKPSVPNRLVQITSTLGAQTVVEYGTAPTDYSDTDISPIPVVKKLTVQNIGHGQPSMVTQYAYAGGAYVADPATGQRRFAGFHKVTATESGVDLAAQRVTDTYFHQANGSDSATSEPADTSLALIGKPYYSVVKHPLGTPKRETWQHYGTHTLTAEPGSGRRSQYAYPMETVVKTTEPGATTGTAEVCAYDMTLGERIELRQLGFVTVGSGGAYTDIPGDTRYQFTEYSTNASRTIVKPSRLDIRTSEELADTIARTEYFYDGKPFGVIGSSGNLTKESRWISGNGITVADTTYTHDSFGNELTVAKPRGAVTTHSYDSTHSLVAATTNALGHTTTYEYLTGKLRKITDPNGRITSYGYSNKGWLHRATVTTNAGNQRTRQLLDIVYFSTWVIETNTQRINGREDQSWQSIDNLGRPVRVVRRLFNHTTGTYGGFYLKEARTYDALGREVSRSAPYGVPEPSADYSPILAVPVPAGLVTTTTYDIFDRPLSVANVLGTTTFAYVGPETTTTDANGKPKRTRADAYGNLVEVQEFNEGSTYTTAYVYDPRNLLIGVTDALGNVRSFAYNNAGWLIYSEDLHAPGDTDFGSTSFTYDAAGNQLTETQPSGTVTTRVFDLLDRPTSIDGSSTPAADFTLAYDSCTKGVGRLCGVTGLYSLYGLTLSKSFVYGASMPMSTTLTAYEKTFTTSYQYTLSDELSRVTYADGTVVRYAFGDWALPSAVYVTLPGGAETLFATAAYHHTLEPETVTIANGPTLAYAYDASKLYRTSSFSATIGATTLQSYAYSYDSLNNITQIVEPGLTKTYAYDDLYRLLEAVHTPATGPSTTYSYSYDPIGNITLADGAAYAYSGTGKANPHAVTAIGSDLYGYDANGNVVVAPNQTIAYNWQNQPASVITGGTASTVFAYDETGERFLYETASSAEVQVSEEYLVGGGHHLLGDNAPEITVRLGKMPIGLVAGGALNTTITDHLGTPVKQVNGSGTVVESTTYGPFGAALATSGTLNAKRGYTGHEEDADTGLVYAEARYYSPTAQRFLQQDPSHVYLGHQGFQGLIGVDRSQILLDPQQLNSFSYVRNSPVTLIDSTGKTVELVAKSIAFGLGTHMYYKITPDHPSEISIEGVPAGSAMFTFGAYNPDKWNVLNNRLIKDIGLKGVKNHSTDFDTTGRASIIIRPPEGQSDTDFINNLGRAFNALEDQQNYAISGNIMSSSGYSNSNNFVYTLGADVGIEDQVSSFKPRGLTGFGRGLAPSRQPSHSQRAANYFKAKLKTIKARIGNLKKSASMR